MLQLPLKLEQRLKKLISRARDREIFVKEIVEREIEKLEAQGNEGLPSTVGGHAHRSLPKSVGGTLHLYTDGGSRGNPGQAAVGCTLMNPSDGKTVEEYNERIGIQTNNVAEYRALIRGLQMASKHHPHELICYLDSELIVKQLSGEYRVKMPTLQPLFDEALSLAATLPRVSFAHVPRSQNARADWLVNKALDDM